MTGIVARPLASRSRWLILIIAWLALMLSAADRAMWASTAPAAASDLGLTPATALGVFVTAAQAGYLLALLFGSIATDWLGPRRVLSFALIWLGAAAFAFAHVKSVTAGLIVQFCVGVGAAPIFAIGVKLITSWFTLDKRATAISLFMTALSVPTMLVNLFAPIGIATIGWRANYQLVGLLTVAIGVTAIIVVRNGPLLSVAAANLSRPPSLWPLLRSRDYRWLVVANMAGPWASWGFMIWANLLLIDRYQISLVESGRIVASYGLGAFFGLLLVGPICDRLGLSRRRATIACLLVFASALLAVGGIGDLALLRILIPVLGFIAYSYGPLLNTMIVSTAGSLAASAAGVATLLTFAAEGVQPMLIRAIYADGKSFFLVCCALAAGPLLAAFAVSRVRVAGDRAG